MAKKITKKVHTAIYNKDLRVELKDYELLANGNKIEIVPTGEGYFCPEISPTKLLHWPTRKRYLLFGKQLYKTIYFALNKASSCVDFGKDEGVVYGPDEEQKKAANANLLATRIGKDTTQGVPWYAWPLLLLSILQFLLLLNFTGVFM